MDSVTSKAHVSPLQNGHLYYAQIYFQVNQHVINISNFDVNKETFMKHYDSLSSRGTYFI